jgi:hypothetical protein
MQNKIEITGVDLAKFAQKAYELSVPKGMGFLHFREGGLSDSDAKMLVRDEGRIALNMDYVHGRGCKMTVIREDEKLYIDDRWYDHTDEDLEDLLSAFSIKYEKKNREHSIACDCIDCKLKTARN